MKAYDVVSSHILAKLESGVVPWRTAWKIALPKSFGSGRAYRGINIVLLSCSGFSSRYWITYREAERHGAHVRKGEKGTPVIYWHWRTAEEQARLVAEGKCTNPAPCIPFVSSVFNLDQVEGLERPADDVPMVCQDVGIAAERVVRCMRSAPHLHHSIGAQPSYCVATDTVSMPFVGQFEEAPLYYVNLFHELTHATGHPSRLNRLTAGDPQHAWGGSLYSYEELIAEFGAAFLCGQVGLAEPRILDDSASYIAGWMNFIRQDKSALLRAASTVPRL